MFDSEWKNPWADGLWRGQRFCHAYGVFPPDDYDMQFHEDLLDILDNWPDMTVEEVGDALAGVALRDDYEGERLRDFIFETDALDEWFKVHPKTVHVNSPDKTYEFFAEVMECQVKSWVCNELREFIEQYRKAQAEAHAKRAKERETA